jgi:predicted transcriptional regulator
MRINKADFKIILNHMKSLSPLENIELIKQTQDGKTKYDDINQFINVYSAKKVSNLMDKINTEFLISNNNIHDGGSVNKDLPKNIKKQLKQIVKKLKSQLNALKEKDKELTERENKLNQIESN